MHKEQSRQTTFYFTSKSMDGTWLDLSAMCNISDGTWLDVWSQHYEECAYDRTPGGMLLIW